MDGDGDVGWDVRLLMVQYTAVTGSWGGFIGSKRQSQLLETEKRISGVVTVSAIIIDASIDARNRVLNNTHKKTAPT